MVLSPDGTLAVYWSEEFGSRQVYIRSFPEAGAPTRVSQGDGQRPFWAPDGNIVYYWATRGGDHFIAARIQRNPTPVVLSQDTLFTTDYVQMFTDLHPDGDRLVAPLRVGAATARADEISERERFFVVTNWFEELRQRMGNP